MSVPETKFTLVYVVNDVSKLPSQQLQSPDMNRFNIPWRIGFYREMDLFVVHLICCQPRTNKIWTVATKGTIKTILTNGTFSFTPFQFTAANDSQYGGTGHSSHISHLIDDTFVIEVDVTIDSMAGIEKPEKIRNFGVEAEELSDVVLKIDEEKFHVSKMYLSAQSTYFKSLLMGKFEEDKKRVVELKDINPDNFQVFLELLYVDKTLTDSNIEDVLKLVELYDAKNAARLCEQYLIFESTHSMRTKLKIAAQYKFKDLRTHCLSNVFCRAGIRAIKGISVDEWDDLAQFDSSIVNDLFELSMSLGN